MSSVSSSTLLGAQDDVQDLIVFELDVPSMPFFLLAWNEMPGIWKTLDMPGS
jgi:hypothetical protein